MARRRTRAEIDRSYLIADVLSKAGGAALLLVALVAVATPFGWADAAAAGLQQYLAVMGAMVALGVALHIAGRRLRRSVTHWDAD